MIDTTSFFHAGHASILTIERVNSIARFKGNLFPFMCRFSLFVDHLNSRVTYVSPVRKGCIYKYASLCIFITSTLSNSPRFPWTTRGCVGGSFS